MEQPTEKKNEVDKTYIEQFEKLKWKFALENSNIGIWDWDNTNNLDRVFFSKESKRILGYKEGEGFHFGSNSQDWNDRVHPDDREKYFKDFQDHLNGIRPIYENEHRILCNDGTYKWISDKGKIIERDANGNPIRVIGTHTDITLHVENEEKLKNTLDLITNQNKKLKNFAHIVTHNLKEHSGNFESLLQFYDESESDSDRKELVNYLKVLSVSLSKTISNLNQIVSVESKKEISVEKIYIVKYIENVTKILDVFINDSNTTIVNTINEDLFIYFSPAYTESIIQNLLSNAIKYKHPDRSPIINLSASIVDDNIILKVKDNGLGIDLDKYGNEVFGLYRTFHSNQNSEGVGLYLVKSQVESFGGRIEIESTVNVGTTFIITIPNTKAQLE